MENENGNISKSTRNQETRSEESSSKTGSQESSRQKSGSEKTGSQETRSEKSGWQESGWQGYSGRVILPRKGRSVSPPFFSGFRRNPNFSAGCVRFFLSQEDRRQSEKDKKSATVGNGGDHYAGACRRVSPELVKR